LCVLGRLYHCPSSSLNTPSLFPLQCLYACCFLSETALHWAISFSSSDLSSSMTTTYKHNDFLCSCHFNLSCCLFSVWYLSSSTAIPYEDRDFACFVYCCIPRIGTQ
jgi:hypothetical protein